MTNKKYFGTDGIRGKVGVHPITPDFMFKMGEAIGKFILNKNLKPVVVIGKDTRSSSFVIESNLEAGLISSGVDIYLVGVLPSPAIAYLTEHLDAELGISITASHNAFTDNGIKIFTSKGFKLLDAEELEIEKLIGQTDTITKNKYLGKTEIINDAEKQYIEFCLDSITKNTDFNKLKIILDCANGATYNVGPKIFNCICNNIITINNKPNGENINKNSGACQVNNLQRFVIKEKADIGVAFDGDGDRVIMVDNKGEIIDGDELLFIMLNNLINKENYNGGLVGTIMSNLGLEVAAKKLGVDFIRTQVGDHFIAEKLREKNWTLGGEASGHIIDFSKSPTGDGILSALNILQIATDANESLHQLKQNMKKFPQKTINIPYNGSKIDLQSHAMQDLVKNHEETLKPHGRILLRYSGTEPLLRVMVEGENELEVTELADKLSTKIHQKFAGNTNSQTTSKNV